MINKIEQADLDYHMVVLEQNRAAQAVINSWSNYLTQKYKLSEGDSITPEGIIKHLEEPHGT